MPVGIQRLNAKRSHPNDRIVFIKPLKGPSEKVAQDFLERIAAQCLPVMKDHSLSVMTLEEYEFNREFVGRNFNGGEVIQLVLRSRSGRWLPFEYVQMVMMHELAHCKHMNHSRYFWGVRNQYAEQMRGLWSRGYTGEGIWGRGALLGTGEFQNNPVLPGEALPEHLCGGTYRSRGRKRKAKPKLSYKEQKERRIRKKFGVNGQALGADEVAKVKLEKGKKVQAKPRVAGSARGRELRAAAALARFDQRKQEDEDQEDIKFKEEEVEGETSGSGESEYEYDPADIKTEDAVDLNGQRLLDGKGRGMIKVCEDESPDDYDAQKELLELQSAKSWRQMRLDFQPDASTEAAGSTRSGKAPKREPSPRPPPPPSELPKSEYLPIKGEDDDGGLDSSVTKRPQSPKIKREDEDDEVVPVSTRVGETTGPSVKAAPEPELANPRQATSEVNAAGRVACGVCSFENTTLSITCGACSNVLDPASVPNAWRCQKAACEGNEYVNPGDYGICGVCGQSRSDSEAPRTSGST